jgi:phosphate uptake regulator
MIMERKLVKHGEFTLMVSLPSKWIKNNKLDKGDKINLEQTGNTLSITSEKISSEKSNKTIEVSGLSPLINRYLVAQYVKGVDELEIKFKHPKEIVDFQNRVINELLGFEIIRQSQNSVLIKDLTGISNQDIDEVIKRIFFIINSMFEELLIALEKKQTLSPVIQSDISINKFCNFCLRLLNKKGYKDFEKTSQVYSIVEGLEEIGDTIKYFAKELERNRKIEKNHLVVIEDLKKSFDLFEDLFFNFSDEKSVEFAKRFESTNKKINKKNSVDFYLYDLNMNIVKMINNLLAMND